MNEEMPTLSTQSKILESGKQYFLKDGFKNAPLRHIVKDAGYTLGAFYGYYKTKEDLFYALTDDVASGFTQIVSSIRDDMNKLPPEQMFSSMLDCYIVRLHELVDYICQHRMEMILLLNSSDGTKYENYMDTFRIENHNRISNAVQKVSDQPVSMNTSLIDMLMRGYFNILSRIIIEIDDKEQMYTMMRDVALVYKNGMSSVAFS